MQNSCYSDDELELLTASLTAIENGEQVCPTGEPQVSSNDPKPNVILIGSVSTASIFIALGIAIGIYVYIYRKRRRMTTLHPDTSLTTRPLPPPPLAPRPKNPSYIEILDGKHIFRVDNDYSYTQDHIYEYIEGHYLEPLEPPKPESDTMTTTTELPQESEMNSDTEIK